MRGRGCLCFDNSGHGKSGIDHTVTALPLAHIIIAYSTELFMKAVALPFYFISSFILPDKNGSYYRRKCSAYWNIVQLCARLNILYTVIF